MPTAIYTEQVTDPMAWTGADFTSKEDCFVSTLETIVAATTQRVSAAHRQPGDLREKLVAALGAFMEVVVEEPAAATLATVESLALGVAGVPHRDRALASFEMMIRQSFERAQEKREVPDTTIRAIAAGIRGVTYRRLRTGSQAELPGLVEPLVDWAMGYQSREAEAVERAARQAEKPAEPGPPPKELEWTEPPNSARSKAELSQRERIVRATAQVVAEKGYAALSIPGITGVAGVSNQTFYEHFSNKREPFLAAFEASAFAGLAAATAAYETAGDRPEAVGAGIRAMVEHVAGNELFARITFFELQTAGPIALDRADMMMDRFMDFLRPENAAKGLGTPPPEPILQAIGSGIWGAIQHELAKGRSRRLPGLAPELTRIALMPFDPR